MENCFKNFKSTSKHYYFWLYNYLVIGRDGLHNFKRCVSIEYRFYLNSHNFIKKTRNSGFFLVGLVTRLLHFVKHIEVMRFNIIFY